MSQARCSPMMKHGSGGNQKTLTSGGEAPLVQAALFSPTAQGVEKSADSGARLGEGTRRKMRAMMGMGVNPGVVGALLDMAGYRQAHVQYLTGPIVVHGAWYQDSLPAWLLPAIYQDRLEQIFAEDEGGYIGERATLGEVAAVLMAASLEAPLGPEWTRVYIWAAGRTYNKHRAPQVGGAFEEFLSPDPVTAELSDYERREFLEKLQRDIWRKVVRAAQERQREVGRTVRSSTRSASSLPATIQLDLFRSSGALREGDGGKQEDRDGQSQGQHRPPQDPCRQAGG